MRPRTRMLDDPLIERIVDEARDLLCTAGVTIHNPGVLSLLGDHGARVDLASSRAFIPGALVDRAVASAPCPERVPAAFLSKARQWPSGEKMPPSW